jgi:threonine dehydrogenase-like Zn-dependent dehydrogenase
MQGYYPDPLTIDFWRAHQRRLTLTFPCGFDDAGVAEGLRLLAERRLTVEPLISHRFAATHAPDAFRLMLERPSEVLAIVLNWDA